MPLSQKLFAISVAIAFMLIVIHLARKRKLRVEYSILWTITSIILLALVLWYDTLVFVTRWIGAVLPTTTLFIFSLLFLLFLNLHFSVKLSELSEQVKNLGQQFGIHTMKKNDLTAEDAEVAERRKHL